MIRGARIVDGTGAPWRRGDVAVEGDRISAIGNDLAGALVIDAEDRVLAPGFIDMHSHADVALLDEPVAEPQLAQGITTALLGQDGISVAPVLPGSAEIVERLAGELNGVAAEGCRWPSVGAYLDRLDGAAAVNFAYLVPHGTLRAQVLGGEDRAALPAEVERLRALVAGALAEGACGMSTGLEYVPSRATGFDELRALLEVVAAAGGIHVSHIRDYDKRFDAAIDEMLELSRQTGVPAHFSHFLAWGRRNHGRMPDLLAGLSRARREGLDVSLDVYPYTASSTVATYFLPAELRDLGPAELLARLSGEDGRRRAAQAIDPGPAGVDVAWDALTVAGGLAELGLAAEPGVGERRLPALAAARGQSVGELVCDLVLATEGRAMLIVDGCQEADVRAALAHPLTVLGSDGVPIGEAPHPRGWGAFARVLETYVNQVGLLSLERAVAAMSGRPAARLGLGDRGLVRPGMAADLLLFDPDAVAAPASFDRPRQLARGMDLVLVNGKAVWRDGEPTGDLPGRALRSGPSRLAISSPESRAS